MLHSYFKINDNTAINTLELRSVYEQGLCMTKTGCVPLCELLSSVRLAFVWLFRRRLVCWNIFVLMVYGLQGWVNFWLALILFVSFGLVLIGVFLVWLFFFF